MDIREQLNQKTLNIQTSCKDCIFAVYEGMTQTGCEFNRIETFRERGTNIVEAYDHDKEFFVIDRFCNRCRNQDWADEQKGDNYKDIVTEESRLQIDIFIYIDKSNTVEDIEASLTNFDELFLLPSTIILVNNNDGIKSEDLLVLIKKQKHDFKWRIERIIELDCSKLRAIDLSMKRCKSTYYSVVDAGDIISQSFCQGINRLLNDELFQFSMITNGKEYNKSVIQTQLHKILAGNKKRSIIEKIEELAEEQNAHNMIIKWGNIQ